MRLSRLTIIYAIYVIVSASFMRYVLDYLFDTIGISGVSLIIWAAFALLAALAVFFIYRRKPSLWKLVSFLVLLTAGAIYASRMKIVEERFHLLQFGLLGWLSTNDLFKKNTGIAKVMISFLFCALVVVADELLQWWLPNRYGDIRDVIFGILGALWGIVLFLLIKTGKSDSAETIMT
ncbi:MAG: VanZ family protein [Endomicrobiales bacterium]|nr:VanZ family protein [Endomicrobiales bacterium]